MEAKQANQQNYSEPFILFELAGQAEQEMPSPAQ